MKIVECPECAGFKNMISRPIYKKGKLIIIKIECEFCRGIGKVLENSIRFRWKDRGEILKKYRLEVLGLSLRAAAKEFRIDASNLSKMERGIIKPRNIYLDDQYKRESKEYYELLIKQEDAEL